MPRTCELSCPLVLRRCDSRMIVRAEVLGQFGGTGSRITLNICRRERSGLGGQIWRPRRQELS